MPIPRSGADGALTEARCCDTLRAPQKWRDLLYGMCGLWLTGRNRREVALRAISRAESERIRGYDMAHEVTLITGDGTGPELAAAARQCVDATGVDIRWDVQEAGVDVMEKTGTPLPDAVLASVRRSALRTQGSDHNAGGDGLSQHQRVSAAGARVVRLYPAVQVLSGGAQLLQ